MNLLKKILFRIAGNKIILRLLEKFVLLAQQLIGIGSGTDVRSSGEIILIKKLNALNSSSVTIFDVGANKGDFTEMIISNLNGKVNFQLHCFEPSRISFERLKNRKDLSDKVILNNFGLGRKEEEAVLFYEKEGSGLASLTKRKLDHHNIYFNESEKILIKTLDDYCELNNITNIDLLKIDVEGHELDVLNGSIKMFENKLIKMVSFEFGGCNIDTRTFFQDFYFFFKNYNMEIFRIIPSGKLALLEKYQEIYEQFRTTNFLAIYRV